MCTKAEKITHMYLSCGTVQKYHHIFVRVEAYWQRLFQTLLISNVQQAWRRILHLWYFPK